MAIPISYNIRKLKLRKGLTIMTALGMTTWETSSAGILPAVPRASRPRPGGRRRPPGQPPGRRRYFQW